MEQFDQAGETAPPRPASAGVDDDVDPELAKAIEASYRAQTGEGMHSVEDEMIAEALRLSQLEEDARKRRELGLPEEDEEMLVEDPPQRAPAAVAEGTQPMHGAMQPQSFEAEGTQPMHGAMQPQSFEAGLNNAFMADAVAGGGLSRAEHGETLSPGGMDAEAMAAAAVAEQAEMADHQLAMAIEASYNAQTEDGRASNEDDLMAQALRISQQEEESRQRASLREAQEQELQESILMDQMREQEEKRRRMEEEQLQRLEEERLQVEASKREAEEKAKKEEQEQKKSRIPAEPLAGEPGRADLMFRLPDGKRLRRAFSGTDKIGQVYDYVDVEACDSVGQMGHYRLVSTMPRQCYENRDSTLAEAGLKGQIALVVEACA